jgi:hypothetical protein
VRFAPGSNSAPYIERGVNAARIAHTMPPGCTASPTGRDLKSARREVIDHRPRNLHSARASDRYAPVGCPLCGGALHIDPWWLSPHWICQNGHSYSNMRVLEAELRERAARASNATDAY